MGYKEQEILTEFCSKRLSRRVLPFVPSRQCSLSGKAGSTAGVSGALPLASPVAVLYNQIMDEFSFEAIAQKSVRGVFALVSRTFFVQILGIVANFILTVYLSQGDFGVFVVVSAIVVFFNYFQDIGLAASLIQKKEQLTTHEMRTVFTVQQVLVLVLITPALIFSGQIAKFYDLNSSGHLLLIALLVSLFLSSLRTIPTVLLERNLDFHKLVIPQIVENLVYYSALIILAITGAGIASFTVAVLLRGIIGTIIIYLIKPWPIGISFDLEAFKKLVSFGIPFQTNSILALLKDDLLFVYLGKALPFSQVGYIGFAQKWAFMPLRLVMDNVIRIMFPSFSRLQHEPESLKVAVEKSLFLVSLFIFPTAVGLILFSPSFIEYVPKYEKWQPALLSLTFFALNTVFSSISTPLTNFLNSTGRVKITLYFMVMWTALTWISTLVLLKIYGYNGVAIASFLVSLTSIGVVLISRRYVKFSVISPIFKQLIAAVVMGGIIYLSLSFVNSLITLFGAIFVAGVAYLLVLLVIARNELLKTSRFVLRTVRTKA